MEELDNFTLVETRINELLIELGKLTPGTDTYDKVQDELESQCKVRDSYVKAEQQRLDSNAKNDIAEAELVIKEREAKNGQVRNWLTAITSVLMAGTYVGGSILQNRESYHMEETTLPYKPAKATAQDFMKKIGLIK